jgi:hypothetical protein
VTRIERFAVHVPGLSAHDLPGSPPEPAVPADRAAAVLGRKGLLAKEPATRLALCAVHAAFGLPPGLTKPPASEATGTAVVVASNLGNVETVCAIVDEMRAGSARSVSPLLAPNASSNVIASSIAIRYGFTGPNIMVCSGAAAGLDAVRIALLLLRSGRSSRVVVVGTEPDDAVAGRLAALRTPRGTAAPLRAGAACVVLGNGGHAHQDEGVVLGPVCRHRTADALPAPDQQLHIGPRPGDGAGNGVGGLGEVYGALGVVGVATAAARLLAATDDAARPADSALVTCGDPEDGYASVRLRLVSPPDSVFSVGPRTNTYAGMS